MQFKLPESNDWAHITKGSALEVTIEFSGTAGMVKIFGDSMHLETYTWTSKQTKMHLELSSDKNGNKLWSSLKIEGQDGEDATEEAIEDNAGGPDDSSGNSAATDGSLTPGKHHEKQIRSYFLFASLL